MATAEGITVEVKFEKENSFPSMLRRAKARGMVPMTIVDVGSSDGRWALMARTIWPDATLLLFEPNPVYAAALSEMEAKGALVVRALACAQSSGEKALRMNFEKPYQGVYELDDSMHAAGAPEVVATPVTTIDHQVERLALPGPYLVKLDTHGREHEILSGASSTLKSACGIIAEVYTWSQGPNSLRMSDLIQAIEVAHGFLPADLCEPLRRPYDSRMVQCDMLFEPETAEGMQTPNLW